MLLLRFHPAKIVLIVGILCFLLVACGDVQEIPPISTETITQPAMARTKTLTPPASLIPTPTLSPKQLATKKYILSWRATLAARIETEKAATITHAAENKYVRATQGAFNATMRAKFPGWCDSYEYFSPDGNWVAMSCADHLQVYNLHDVSRVWTVTYNETYEMVYGNGYNAGYINPKHWSADGRYLYFVPHSCCRDGPSQIFVEGDALLRLDLTTGKVSPTLISSNLEFYNFSFSPMGTYLAYFKTLDKFPTLNILNMNTGEEQHIPLSDKYTDAGEVIWSPDSSRVILLARTCENYCSVTYDYWLLIDLENYNQIPLDYIAEKYWILEWATDNSVVLREFPTDDFYLYNLDTHEITPYSKPTPAGSIP